MKILDPNRFLRNGPFTKLMISLLIASLIGMTELVKLFYDTSDQKVYLYFLLSFTVLNILYIGSALFDSRPCYLILKSMFYLFIVCYTLVYLYGEFFDVIILFISEVAYYVFFVPVVVVFLSLQEMKANVFQPADTAAKHGQNS